MGFYNFSRIIKGIIYGLKGITKYLCYSLFLVVFTCICLLFICNKSKAAVPDIVYNSAIEFFEDSNFNSYFLLDTNELILFDNTSTNKFYMSGIPTDSSRGWLCCTEQDASYMVTYLYNISSSGVVSYAGNGVRFGVGDGRYFIAPIVSSNCDVYTNSSFTSLYFEADYSSISFTSPYFSNMSTQASQESLQSGQFTYFVVEPGDIPKTSDIIFDVYNTTYADSADNIVKRYILNQSSPFIIESETYDSGYAYYITARFQDWYQIVNGNSYKIKLSWVNPENPLQVDTAEYSWTMSLTAEQQTTQDQITQDEIKTEAQETNDFLKDDSYNKSEISANMPNSDSYSIPTNEGFNNIFTSFINAFTTEQTTTVRFYIPFTNGAYIDIPSDLTISKIPAPLLLIIQTFYWFMICRYIVKDIASYAEKAKSGDIITGSTDTNIKTEIL